MEDQTDALTGETVTAIPGSDAQTGSVSDAARTLAAYRFKKQNPEATQERQEPAAREPTTESGDEPKAATAEAQPSGDETESATDTPVEAPIEPPRSWTKDEKDRFATLPRETQEYLAQRESERDRAYDRRQNEAAEKLKGLTAKEQAVEQARQQYETALPALLQTLQQNQAGQFSDIKTMDDVNRLAQTDWPRYVMWDAAQKQIAAVQNEVTATTQRQTQEKQNKLVEFAKREGERFIEKAPELADEKQKTALQNKAVGVLRDLGFDDAELGKLWRGESDISIHDHRLQLLVRDAVKFRDAQAAAKTATTKPVPPVQRPGTSQPRGAAQDAVVQNLNKRLEQTGSLKDAARLLNARRAAAR